VQWIADLMNRHNVAPHPSYTSVQGQGIGPLFNAGRVASRIDGSWVGPGLTQVPGLDWQMVAKPKGPAGRANYLHMAIYAITTNSKNPDAAWEWLKFWTDERGYYSKGPGAEEGLPARKSLAAHPRSAAYPWLAESGATKAYADSLDTLRLPRKILDFFPVNNAVTAALADVWQGKVNAKTAIDNIVPVATSMLEKANQS
jgi:multiple sugar transport system substrate-binding protein